MATCRVPFTPLDTSWRTLDSVPGSSSITQSPKPLGLWCWLWLLCMETGEVTGRGAHRGAGRMLRKWCLQCWTQWKPLSCVLQMLTLCVLQLNKSCKKNAVCGSTVWRRLWSRRLKKMMSCPGSVMTSSLRWRRSEHSQPSPALFCLTAHFPVCLISLLHLVYLTSIFSSKLLYFEKTKV